MKWRNDEAGYGAVTKLLHWLTVALLVAQVAVGYLIDDSGHGRGRGRGEGSGRGRGRGGELDLDEATVRVHIALGLLILTLAVVRLLWRLAAPLPAWSERLNDRDRVLQHRIEQLLLLMLFVAPATGLALVVSKDDDLLPLHVASHVLLYVAVAAHVGLSLRRGTLRRMLTVGP